LIENAELNELGAMALARKRELHPQGVTTFIVDRNINYTNACWVDCKFCAFYRDHKDEEAYVLSFDEIGQKIEELIAIGGAIGTGLFLGSAKTISRTLAVGLGRTTPCPPAKP